MKDATRTEASFEPGTVWLVGAGPGDPGLLTLHALDALRRADVIVYDALVSQGVLAMAAPRAHREFAGKRGGRPSHSQKDITSRLIELARQDLRVLRLKGGDPFVFGRGAEEVRALAQAGVRFRVVPGITSGIGGLAYAGIPATSRDVNQALILVAGHPAADGVDRVNWEKFATIREPLVVYMGLSRLSEIASRLISGGMPGETRLAIIIGATSPQQEVIEMTLAEAPGFARTIAATTAPALVVIGAIVGLRDALVKNLLTP
jgi:uroporphyrin-III C-methyltransferase